MGKDKDGWEGKSRQRAEKGVEKRGLVGGGGLAATPTWWRSLHFCFYCCFSILHSCASRFLQVKIPPQCYKRSSGALVPSEMHFPSPAFPFCRPARLLINGD